MKRVILLGTMCLRILFVFFFFAAFSLFAQENVFAATISITEYPSSISIGTEFTVKFKAEGLSTGTYYGKVRIGTGSTLNKGETKNGENWLGDTSSWSDFPTIIVTDSSATTSGVLTARAKSTAEIGDNSLQVRLNNGSNTDSSSVTITLVQAPTSTPTNTPVPTAAPTPTPTKTPTPGPTSTNTPTPTKTPTPAPTTSSSSSPTATKSPTITTAPSSAPKNTSPTPTKTKEVLGQKIEAPTPTTAALDMDPKEPEDSSTVIAALFISIGGIILILCGILAFKPGMINDLLVKLPWKR